MEYRGWWMDKMMVRPFFAILKKHLNSFIDFFHMEEGQKNILESRDCTTKF